MNQTIVLAFVTITTTLAIGASKVKKKNDSKTFFRFGAILSWVLLLFHLFFLPETIIVRTPNPITAEGMQNLLAMIIIILEIVGFYYFGK